MKTAGIILAAGRGSRMRNLTEERPKCMVELAGKPLLHWQLGALRRAGINSILVVRGYLAGRIQASAATGAFATAENPRWEQTNMLSTLLCADEFARKSFALGVERLIVSYSDIVYHWGHVGSLLSCPNDIAITYDTEWEALWTLRFGDPLLDAETFRQEHGLLREIGGKPGSLADIHGQYMGLLSFSQTGWHMMTQLCAELGEVVDKTDMTGFLRLLLSRAIEVGAVPVAGKWCEADSGADLQVYGKALERRDWPHDWR